MKKTDILLSLAVIFFSQPVFSATCNLDQRIDQLMSSYMGDKPGANVLVMEEGTILSHKVYGKADVDNDVDSSATTNYRLASVSKQFTAFAIVYLIDKGLLTLDTKLTDIFEDFPSYGKKIKVRHLLSHTSGLKKYEKNVPSNHQGQLSDADVLEIMKNQSGTLFTPGSGYKYSNSGYAMMANIVAKVTGQPFHDFVRYKILDLLEMEDSIVYKKGDNQVINRAFGHTGQKRSDQNKFSQVLGDGGVYSSAVDYALWERALFYDRDIRRDLIGNDALFEQIFKKARLNNGSRINYGFGWRISSYKGHRTYSHGGSTVGFKNYVVHLPNKKFTVLILTNRRSGNPRRIAERLIDCRF